MGNYTVIEARAEKAIECDQRGGCHGAGVHTAEERQGRSDDEISTLLLEIVCPVCTASAQSHRGHYEATSAACGCALTVTDLLAFHEDEANWRKQA